MESNSNNQDQRKSERLDTAFTLIYQVEKPLALRMELGFTNSIDALMLDLSDLGMAIITRHDLPVGTQLCIKFNIIDLHLEGDARWQPMEITGQTVSNILLPDSSHRIGMRFDRISEADKLAISNFVRRNKLLA